MKKSNLILALSLSLIANLTFGQADPTLGMVGSNSGVVAVGSTIDISITLGNTGTASIPNARLRPVIDAPTSTIFEITALQTGLPAGFSIVQNTGARIIFCNTGFVIPGTSNNTIIILKLRGVTVAPASAVQGNIGYGNGNTTTCAGGPQIAGDVSVNNAASTFVEVIAAPLPLSLLSFTAVAKNCEPLLNWSTENEINVNRFEIERSTADGSNWKKVGTVLSTGANNNVSNQYAFTDKTEGYSFSKTLYRLKMIDNDNTYKNSNIATVILNCNTPKVSVYPNPTTDDKLFVNITGTVGNTEATLSSISGQLLLARKVVNGNNQINVSKFADGIYILAIKDENGFTTNRKVVIKH